MKNLIVVALSLFSLNLFAFEAEVISAEFMVENELCLTIVRVPATGELLGVVEDIRDCFYARLAKKNPHLPLELHDKYLLPLTHKELLQYLQTMDAQLKFYFSEGE